MKNFMLSIAMIPLLATAQTNTHFNHTETTDASPADIWKVWTDVPNWNQWDKGLREAKLKGDFAVGATGHLVPDKGPKAKFVITQVEPMKSYEFKTRIPFGWLIIRRELTSESGVTQFTHDVRFTGLFKKPLGNKLGRRYRKMLPEIMADIRRIAEGS